jgi:glycyl-tRNA synthetase beta chain
MAPREWVEQMPKKAAPERCGKNKNMTQPAQNLLVELFVEELPPKALQKLGDAFATQNLLGDQLKAQGLATVLGDLGGHHPPFASPRRLAAHVTAVADKAADKAVQQKLMPVTVGLDKPTATPRPRC